MTPYEKAFHETLLALGQEQLRNLVVVGGWCPYLYAKYVWKQESPFPSTVDVDFAVKKMSPDRFSGPVYKRLFDAKLIPRKMDVEDINRVQFAYVSGRLLVPVEFVTTLSVLPRGQKPPKGPYVACDPLPELDVALKVPPLLQTIAYQGEDLDVQIASPAAFIVVKGLLVERRANAAKTPKDLAGVAFVLRYAPDIRKVMEEIKSLRRHASFREFREIVRALFRGDGRGYGMLRPFFSQWGVPGERVEEQIKKTFEPLMEAMNGPA